MCPTGIAGRVTNIVGDCACRLAHHSQVRTACYTCPLATELLYSTFLCTANPSRTFPRLPEQRNRSNCAARGTSETSEVGLRGRGARRDLVQTPTVGRRSRQRRLLPPSPCTRASFGCLWCISSSCLLDPARQLDASAAAIPPLPALEPPTQARTRDAPRASCHV